MTPNTMCTFSEIWGPQAVGRGMKGFGRWRPFGAGVRPALPPPLPPPPHQTRPGWHLAIRNPPALRDTPHIRCGGERPPNVTVMGMTECEALQLAWEGRRGAHAVSVSAVSIPL